MEESNLASFFVDTEIEFPGIFLDTVANAIAMASLAPAYIGLYLSVVSGYLIAAFVAGKKLNQKQVLLINSIFVVSSIFLAANALSVFIGSNAQYLALNIAESARTFLYAWIAFDLVIFLIMMIGVYACLGFMKDIRESSENPDT